MFFAKNQSQSCKCSHCSRRRERGIVLVSESLYLSESLFVRPRSLSVPQQFLKVAFVFSGQCVQYHPCRLSLHPSPNTVATPPRQPLLRNSFGNFPIFISARYYIKNSKLAPFSPESSLSVIKDSQPLTISAALSLPLRVLSRHPALSNLPFLLSLFDLPRFISLPLHSTRHRRSKDFSLFLCPFFELSTLVSLSRL